LLEVTRFFPGLVVGAGPDNEPPQQDFNPAIDHVAASLISDIPMDEQDLIIDAGATVEAHGHPSVMTSNNAALAWAERAAKSEAYAQAIEARCAQAKAAVQAIEARAAEAKAAAHEWELRAEGARRTAESDAAASQTARLVAEASASAWSDMTRLAYADEDELLDVTDSTVTSTSATPSSPSRLGEVHPAPDPSTPSPAPGTKRMRRQVAYESPLSDPRPMRVARTTDADGSIVIHNSVQVNTVSPRASCEPEPALSVWPTTDAFLATLGKEEHQAWTRALVKYFHDRAEWAGLLASRLSLSASDAEALAKHMHNDWTQERLAQVNMDADMLK